jgi:hypothetical protein
MDTLENNNTLTQVAKAILENVHIYGVGDFITFLTDHVDAPLGWGRIQQDENILKGAYFVCNESHDRYATRRRILGYDLGNANAFAYKVADPAVDALMHSLPSSSVREMLGINVRAYHSSDSPELLDAFGSHIQVGDLVSYIPYPANHISIGRVIQMDVTSGEVVVRDAMNSIVTSAVFYSSVVLLPVPEDMRSSIQAMTRDDFDHLYF